MKLFLAAAALMLSSAHAHGQVKCGQGVIGRMACDDKEIQALVERNQDKAASLKCTGVERSELDVIRRAWDRQANACAASADAKSCLVEQLSSEDEYLSKISHCDVAKFPVKFEMPVPSYVKEHPQTYKDAAVKVLGVVRMSSCAADSTSRSGKISDYGNERAWIAVEFKSMPLAQRRFLCKQPLSAWRGTIHLSDRNIPSLYSVDVLGVPLP